MKTADNSKSGGSEKGHLPGWDGMKVQVTNYEDLQFSIQQLKVKLFELACIESVKYSLEHETPGQDRSGRDETGLAGARPVWPGQDRSGRGKTGPDPKKI